MDALTKSIPQEITSNIEEHRCRIISLNMPFNVDAALSFNYQVVPAVKAHSLQLSF